MNVIKCVFLKHYMLLVTIALCCVFNSKEKLCPNWSCKVFIPYRLQIYMNSLDFHNLVDCVSILLYLRSQNAGLKILSFLLSYEHLPSDFSEVVSGTCTLNDNIVDVVNVIVQIGYMYMFFPNREPCPVPESYNIDNWLPHSRTGQVR